MSLGEERKEYLQSMAIPMKAYFKKHKEIEVTEDELINRFRLAGNEVRYCISKIVHSHECYNLINVRDKVYVYTTDKSTLMKWWKRKDKIMKPKYIQMAKIKKMCKGA